MSDVFAKLEALHSDLQTNGVDGDHREVCIADRSLIVGRCVRQRCFRNHLGDPRSLSGKPSCKRSSVSNDQLPRALLRGKLTQTLFLGHRAGEGHHARYLHSVAEAGSIVLHVTNNMNEGEKDREDGADGEEVGETAAAKATEKITKKTRKSEDQVHPKKRNND